MNKAFLFIVILTLGNKGFTQIPPGYYNAAENLSGEPLRTALYNIINDHSVKDYTSLWGYFQTTDNNGGIVWDMYTDNPSGSATYTYNFGSAQCGNYTSEGDCFNREHSFPKSWFNDALPMFSDLFHLYPTDGWVNGKRANYPYGEVNSPTYISSNGSKLGANVYPGYSGTVFEPIDAYKGDFARTYFYMVTRYKNVSSTWTSDMLIGDNLSDWAKTMLISWDASDPVSQKEIDRNEAVYAIQGNRNPFIDMPSWIDWIWGPTASVSVTGKSQLSMYNVDGLLRVNNISSKQVSLNIVNMLGTTVKEISIQQGESRIELDFPRGMYIATSTIEGIVYSLKFVQ